MLFFYCSTLSAPISRCIKCLAFNWERTSFLCVFDMNITFSISNMLDERKKELISAECTMITSKFATKTKTPLLAKSFYSIFYVLCGGSGNYRKKWPQEVRFSEWIIYGRHPFSMLQRHYNRKGDSQRFCLHNTASNSFANFQLPHSLPHGTSFQLQNHDDETDGW